MLQGRKITEFSFSDEERDLRGGVSGAERIQAFDLIIILIFT